MMNGVNTSVTEKRHFFGWRPAIVQKVHIASYATLQLYQGTVTW